MKRISIFFIGLVSLLFISSCGEEVAPTTGTVDGQILDFHTGQPLANVLVYTVPPSETSYTDATGKFVFEKVLPGDYIIYAERDGYYKNLVSISIQAGKTSMAKLPMKSELSDNDPPSKPVLTFPANNSRKKPEPITFAWACSDVDGDDITYDIFMSEQNPPLTKIAENELNRQYYVSQLKDSTVYYWRVVAKDEHGAVSESNIFSFQTDSYKPPIIPFPSNLIFYMDFAEGNIKERASNLSVNVSSSVYATTQEDRNCGYFDSGDKTSIIAPSPTIFNTGDVFSTGCFVFINSNFGTGTNEYVDILSRFGGSGGKESSWNIGIKLSSRRLIAHTYNYSTGIEEFPTNAELPLGTWVHVALVKNKGLIRLYLNGEEVLMRENAKAAQNSDYGFTIGKRVNDYSYFTGYIDNVFFTNKALTIDEIKHLSTFPD